MRAIPLATAALLVAFAGCGGKAHRDSSAAASGVLAPGKVPRAAHSNPHKEIPTRFGRAVQLPYESTVLLVTAVRVANLGHTRTHGERRRQVGVVVGIRNIGTTSWRGSPAGLSRLAVSRHDAPEDVIATEGASLGPCPAPLARTRAAVTRSSLELPPGRTSFVCVRFSLPPGISPILYKFAAQASDYVDDPPPPGHGYGVWVLPGTLVEACRFDPGSVRGRCHGLEEGEKD
jgi:hypothetical protein